MSFNSASPHAAILEEAVAELMGAPISDRFATQLPSRPAIPARADHAEREASEGVAADPSVLDTDAQSVNSDGVEQQRQSRLALWHSQGDLRDSAA